MDGWLGFNGILSTQVTDIIVNTFWQPMLDNSVCLWQVGALQKQWEIGLWLLWGAYRKSPPGYSVNVNWRYNRCQF